MEPYDRDKPNEFKQSSSKKVAEDGAEGKLRRRSAETLNSTLREGISTDFLLEVREKFLLPSSEKPYLLVLQQKLFPYVNIKLHLAQPSELFAH